MMGNIPDLLAYPKILPLDQIPEINDQFVYVVKGYPTDGVAVLIYRGDGQVFIRCSDFNAVLLDPNADTKSSKLAMRFISEISPNVIGLMKTARINQAIYYIVGDDPMLVDVRLSLNKFAGPGMIRDLFSKIVKTQEVIKTISLTSDTIGAIKAGNGNYAGNLILKTSAFKTINRGVPPNQQMLPMYATITRM